MPENIPKPGESFHGFHVRSVTPVEEMRMHAIELEHDRSGARMMHLLTDDDENLFSINFLTPPQDDTGLPHILEHAVLGRSRKFPVREPFFEMVKISAATFINAMTGPDMTYYPVCSNVKRDLFNLAEVYCDAVFHPMLTEETFKREGHHLAVEASGELTVRGIVYNEMKGVYSMPESLLERSMARDLFPDTIYGRDSGGDPDHIPDLTHKAFLEFHRTYYHPSNALFVFYGNIPTREYAAFLADKLAEFQRLDIHPSLPPQPRWTEPRKIEESYPVDEGSALAEKTFLGLAWWTGSVVEPEELFALHVISQALLGNQAAPLRKAIIDSRLGQDLAAAGDFFMGRENVFRLVLRGSEPERAEEFQNLVLNTLKRVAREGMDPQLFRAAFQQIAVDELEIGSQFPLRALGRLLDAWPYGGDPFTFLRTRSRIERCRERFEKEPEFFGRLITQRLIENPHRLEIVLRPDASLEKASTERFRGRMKHVATKMDSAALAKVGAEAAEIERLSGEPNPPEAIALLPQLKVEELPKRPLHVPTRLGTLDGGAVLLRNDLFANTLNYLQLNFDLTGLPEELWPFVPAYAEAVHKLGAAGMNYEEIARRVAANTGGIQCAPSMQMGVAEAKPLITGVKFALTAMDDRIEPALDILEAVVFSVDPKDRARLRDVLIQMRAGLRARLVNNGMVTALTHAARGFSARSYLAEVVAGLPQLRLAEKNADKFDDLFEEIVTRVEAIRDFFLAHGKLTASFTGSDKPEERVRARLNAWLRRNQTKPAPQTGVGYVPYTQPPHEGLAAPSRIAHCARVFPGPHYSNSDTAFIELGVHLASLDYVLPEIRLKGNAYGAGFEHDALAGEFRLRSFRDPNIKRTLDIFNGLREYVHAAKWTQTEINHAIIAVSKRDLQPLRPGSATGIALQRFLIGLTPEMREARYAQRLAATPERVKKALLGSLDATFANSAVCVSASRNMLEEANKTLEKRLEITDIET